MTSEARTAWTKASTAADVNAVENRIVKKTKRREEEGFWAVATTAAGVYRERASGYVSIYSIRPVRFPKPDQQQAGRPTCQQIRSQSVCHVALPRLAGEAISGHRGVRRVLALFSPPPCVPLHRARPLHGHSALYSHSPLYPRRMTLYSTAQHTWQSKHITPFVRSSTRANPDQSYIPSAARSRTSSRSP